MVKTRARASTATAPQAPQKDVDYTIYGLIAIVAAVLITALFFAQPNVAQSARYGATTVGGNAYATGATNSDGLAPTQCEPSNLCDGTKLIRQQADCSRFEAFCANGCDYRATGATCL